MLSKQVERVFDHRQKRGTGYDFDLESGKGLLFWFPEFARIRTTIEQYWREAHYRRGYDIVFSPHIGVEGLWEQGGHTSYFTDRMYGLVENNPSPEDNVKYRLRSMNCPLHILMYKNAPRFSDELPIRWAELGTVYRFEKPSDLKYGMIRVRNYTPDDAHIFCRRNQVEEEVFNVLSFAVEMLREFGFEPEDYELRLSGDPDENTVPPHEAQWAQGILKEAVKKILKGKRILPERGNSLFYGVKLDLEIADCKERRWACSTVHIDTYLPQRFGLSYQCGTRKERPIIIHRTLLGSMERFTALLLDHYDGKLPVWLSPTQVIVLPVSEQKNGDYAREVYHKLMKHGVRAKLDVRPETLPLRKRDAHLACVPYVAVVGDGEMIGHTVAVSDRSEKEPVEYSIDDFLAKVVLESCSPRLC